MRGRAAYYSGHADLMGGSGKAEGFAQALPMADGPTIGKLRRLR
jgi:hypothetical protein